MHENSKIQMQLEDHSSSSNNLQKEVKKELQNQPQELALEELMDEINIEIVDGIVNLSVPEPVFMLLQTVIKKLNINLLNESEIER